MKVSNYVSTIDEIFFQFIVAVLFSSIYEVHGPVTRESKCVNNDNFVGYDISEVSIKNTRLIQRHIYTSMRHLWWSFYVKIVID